MPEPLYDRRIRVAGPPPVNLVHDTLYRRARHALVDRLHAADDAVRRATRGGRARLLFEAASPMSLAIFKPVLDRLRLDPRIDVWFTTSDRSWRASDIFGAEARGRVVTPAIARLMKFDAYVNTDFWNMTWLPRRTRRLHLFHGVAGKYGLDAPVRLAPVIASFTRILFPNADRLGKYVAAGLVDPDEPAAALIGYPKVDCLVDGSLDRAAIERALGIDSSRPTVLYAPTWSPYSSLQTGGVETIRSLAALDVNVIVKLHDRSYDRSRRGSGGVDWRLALDALARECGVHIAAGYDASPYLFVSDVLVTDHSSVGFEFMLLDRPVVVIDCPDLVARARVSRDKVRRLRRASRVVSRAADAGAAVSRELADAGRLSAERRAVASDLFYRAGTATARAVQCVYDVLAIPRATAALSTETIVPSFSQARSDERFIG
jgi:hypothetical protein